MAIEKITRGLSLSCCLFLGSCTGSTYSSHFDCPYGTGAGCASLSKVNKMIDRHEIELDEGESVCSSGACNLRKKQVYIYYGPDQMSKVISIDESTNG
jgi:conjugal transfer pilus assembly protein TraV